MRVTKNHFMHNVVHIYNNYTKFELDQIRICRENTTCTFTFPTPLWPRNLVKVTKLYESDKLHGGHTQFERSNFHSL